MSPKCHAFRYLQWRAVVRKERKVSEGGSFHSCHRDVDVGLVRQDCVRIIPTTRVGAGCQRTYRFGRYVGVRRRRRRGTAENYVDSTQRWIVYQNVGRHCSRSTVRRDSQRYVDFEWNGRSLVRRRQLAAVFAQSVYVPQTLTEAP